LNIPVERADFSIDLLEVALDQEFAVWMLKHSIIIFTQHILITETRPFPLDSVARGQVLAAEFVLEHLYFFLSYRFARPHFFFLGEQSSRALQRLFDHWAHFAVFG
jgi:hypothetical protein